MHLNRSVFYALLFSSGILHTTCSGSPLPIPEIDVERSSSGTRTPSSGVRSLQDPGSPPSPHRPSLDTGSPLSSQQHPSSDTGSPSSQHSPETGSSLPIRNRPSSNTGSPLPGRPEEPEASAPLASLKLKIMEGPKGRQPSSIFRPALFYNFLKAGLDHYASPKLPKVASHPDSIHYEIDEKITPIPQDTITRPDGYSEEWYLFHFESGEQKKEQSENICEDDSLGRLVLVHNPRNPMDHRQSMMVIQDLHTDHVVELLNIGPDEDLQFYNPDPKDPNAVGVHASQIRPSSDTRSPLTGSSYLDHWVSPSQRTIASLKLEIIGGSGVPSMLIRPALIYNSLEAGLHQYASTKLPEVAAHPKTIRYEIDKGIIPIPSSTVRRRDGTLRVQYRYQFKPGETNEEQSKKICEGGDSGLLTFVVRSSLTSLDRGQTRMVIKGDSGNELINIGPDKQFRFHDISNLNNPDAVLVFDAKRVMEDY
ncbi:hypothetical protein FB446DRAFT_717746 [Lentinula raphanica]|nr:hypothetical protein FB446DRAFT_717746 [Lentinula raphanica]